jgi:hypothetical protein
MGRSIDSFRREIDSLWRGRWNGRFHRALARDSLWRIKQMLATRLSSSVIERIVYDEEAGALSICFRETGRYLYSGVPRAIYEGLKKAPSPGRYFNECIKRRFPCRPDPERRRFRPVAEEVPRRGEAAARGPSGLSRRPCGG